MTLWRIYDKPADHPDGYIARRFEVGDGGAAPTGDMLKGELETLRDIFWRAGLLKLSRNARDEPQIVETWV